MYGAIHEKYMMQCLAKNAPNGSIYNLGQAEVMLHSQFFRELIFCLIHFIQMTENIYVLMMLLNSQ